MSIRSYLLRAARLSSARTRNLSCTSSSKFSSKIWRVLTIASLISPDGGKVLASASSNEPEVRTQLGGAKGKGGNVAAAKIVGARIAEKAKAVGVETVAFDRSGFLYHGRVKALADAAREAGLKF
jgi:large subunit ribosomal protein L18